MKLQCDLFDFAYVPGWYWQLDCLAEMALPEPWRFKEPVYATKNPDTPILERYIHSIFKKQSIDFNGESDPAEAARHFHVENEFCCFHTGLYTGRYKAVYACFDRNKKPASMRGWYMYDESNIVAVYAERKRFWHMMNAISNTAELEKGISLEFRNLISKFQKEMDVLYMESSDIYHEIISKKNSHNFH